MSTVADADLVVVLYNGAVVERGHSAELLRRGGRYAELVGRRGSLVTGLDTGR